MIASVYARPVTQRSGNAEPARCRFLVVGNAYREPGRCVKTNGLRALTHQGRRVAACAHHRAVAEAGRGTIASTKETK